MASRSSTLAKNTLILTIGKISTQAITFFLLPLYTAYLSKEDYGIVDYVATLISLLFPILNLQIEQALFRYMVAHRSNDTKLKEIVSSGFSFTLFQLLWFILAFVASSPFLHNDYKWFLLANLVVGTVNFTFLQILRGLGDNTGYAISSFVSSAITILLNIVFIVLFGWGANGMLLSQIIGCAFSILYITYRAHLWNYYCPRWFNKEVFKELITYSAPLVPNELSWWVIRASDRIIISNFINLGANGIIAVAHKFPSIFIIFYNIFGMAWTEAVVLHLKESDGEAFFVETVNRVFKIFSCGSLLLTTAMPLVFPLFVNKNFEEAYNLIPLYLIGCLFNVVIGLISTVYIVHEMTSTIAKTSLISAFICLISDLLLVCFIGVYASPISYILGFGVMMLYRNHDLKNYIHLTWDCKYILSFCFALVLALICYYYKHSILNIIVFACSLGYAYFYNKELMLSTWQKAQNLLKQQ